MTFKKRQSWEKKETPTYLQLATNRFEYSRKGWTKWICATTALKKYFVLLILLQSQEPTNAILSFVFFFNLTHLNIWSHPWTFSNEMSAFEFPSYRQLCSFPVNCTRFYKEKNVSAAAARFDPRLESITLYNMLIRSLKKSKVTPYFFQPELNVQPPLRCHGRGTGAHTLIYTIFSNK